MNRASLAAALCLAFALVVPIRSAAQPESAVPRVGVLWGGETSFAAPYLDSARRAMARLGHVEGKTYVVEPRFGERKAGAADVLAADLVQRKVDVIVAAGDPAIQAARRATSTIPIVMVAAGDPVKSGLVASLARPGGNVTGLTFPTSELAGKRLEILKDLVPAVSRVAILWNPDNPGGAADLKAAQAAAETLHLALVSVEARKVADFPQAFKTMADERVQAVLVLTDPITSNFAGKVVADHALKSRLPLFCDLAEFARSGALVSYGPNLLSMVERAAVFVDKILKGAKPAELPIEQPTKFELLVNLKTAKALGIVVPPSFLMRADDVMQ